MSWITEDTFILDTKKVIMITNGAKKTSKGFAKLKIGPTFAT